MINNMNKLNWILNVFQFLVIFLNAMLIDLKWYNSLCNETWFDFFYFSAFFCDMGVLVNSASVFELYIKIGAQCPIYISGVGSIAYMYLFLSTFLTLHSWEFNDS